MATQTIAPRTVVSDMMSLEEISDQLKLTGHPASVSTIRRWIQRGGIRVERYDRRDYVSYTDILIAHQKAVASRY